MKKELHVGNLVQTVVEDKGWTVAEFSRRINKARQTAHNIYKRASIDSDLLIVISEVLNHDFFTDISNFMKSNNQLLDPTIRESEQPESTPKGKGDIHFHINLTEKEGMENVNPDFLKKLNEIAKKINSGWEDPFDKNQE